MMYENNIYFTFFTLKYELMVVVYDPTNDLWNKLDLGFEKYEVSNEGILFLA